MRRLTLVLLSLLLPGLLLLAGGAPARAQAQAEQSVISGTVVNGTPDGGPTAGLPVTLSILGSDSPTDRQTVTDEAGAFSFDQVPLSADGTYQLRASYADVVYPSDVGSLASADGLTGQTLSVYETTADASSIRASIVHVVIQADKQSQSLLVSELIAVNNAGDRTYVAAPSADSQERPKTLRFAVPPDASDVGIIDGLTVEDLVPTDFGFADTSPWVPGMRQVAFSYSLPYQGSDYVFRTALDLPTDAVNILMPKGEAGLESASPFTQDETVLQGQTYLRAKAENLEAGASIQAILTDLPKGGGGGRNLQEVVFAVVVAAALAATAVVAFTLYRRSRLAAAAVGDPSEREKANLLLAIAELDRQHEAGEIEDGEYGRRRSQAKERLEAMW